MGKARRNGTSGDGSADRGVRRILLAAQRLFVREGGAEFSARGVAKEAGISLGAVQHFFPSKDKLLAATLEHVLGEIRREHESIQEKPPFNAKARLLGVIDVLVADACRQDSRRFFLGLHALSCHNAFAERLVSAMCQHHQRRLVGFIGAAAPHLDERQCLDLALQLCAMLDGLTFYTGPGYRVIGSRTRVAAAIKRSVQRLVATDDAGPSAAVGRAAGGAPRKAS